MARLAAVLAAVAVFAAAYAASGLPFLRESVPGMVWGNVSLRVEKALLSSSVGMKGVEVVYRGCSAVGCDGIASRLVEARAGARLTLGWAIVENIGLRLRDGSYLPANLIDSLGGRWNVSWSYTAASGYAVLGIDVKSPRVYTTRCVGHRLFAAVASRGGGCVLVPRSPSPLVEVLPDPVYGDNGVLSAAAVLSKPLRLAVAASAAAAVFAVVETRRRPPLAAA